MPDVFTPNVNLTKPEVGSSRDAWGTKWNDNADKLDAAIKALGDRITNIPAGIPPGTLCHFAHNYVPTGWLRCNGAAASRAGYAALFAVIGTGYGAGDGVGTFNLPDIRGLFMRGLDEGRGLDPGRFTGQYQESQNRDHGHIAVNGGGIVTLYGGGDNVGLLYNAQGAGYYYSALSRDGGAEARPRSIAFPVCIKY